MKITTLAGLSTVSGAGGASWTDTSFHTKSNSTSIECADIKVSGKSLLATLEEINKRLLILVPDPAHLEKHEQLRVAYEQYKILESLLTS